MNPIDVLARYKAKPRILTREFIDLLLAQKFNPEEIRPLVPVLRYFRDTEGHTKEVYYPWLLETPSACRPEILEFMNIWAEEEKTHADTLDWFITSCGLRGYAPPTDTATAGLYEFFAKAGMKMASSHFIPVHMVWGMIVELSTSLGYRFILERTSVPSLQRLVKGIISEESRHYSVYRGMANYFLESSAAARALTYFSIRLFWRPVGATEAELRQAAPAFAMFAGRMNTFHSHVTCQIQKLPGLAKLNLTKLAERHVQRAMRYRSAA